MEISWLEMERTHGLLASKKYRRRRVFHSLQIPGQNKERQNLFIENDRPDTVLSIYKWYIEILTHIILITVLWDDTIL